MDEKAKQWAPAIAIVVAVITLIGTNNKVNDLAGRVEVLDAQVQRVESLAQGVNELDAQLDDINSEVAELSMIREDLVHAIRRGIKEAVKEALEEQRLREAQL